jgi:hypothetical protein
LRSNEEFRVLATSYKIFHRETVFPWKSPSGKALIISSPHGERGKTISPSLAATRTLNLYNRRLIGFSFSGKKKGEKFLLFLAFKLKLLKIKKGVKTLFRVFYAIFPGPKIRFAAFLSGVGESG